MYKFIRFRVNYSPYLVVEPLAVHDGRVPDGGAAELVGARVTAEEHGTYVLGLVDNTLLISIPLLI